MMNLIDTKTLRFLMVGIINTAVGTAIMFCLYNIFNCSYWVSSSANYILTSILSYGLNKRFTFNYRGKNLCSSIKFAVNIAVCYFAAYGMAKPVIAAVIDKGYVPLQENIAMFAGMCIFTALNYLGQRFFVFKDSDMRHRLNYKDKYNIWINSKYIDESDRKILLDMSDEERYELFYRDIEFGTSGMRGKVGLGANRINKYTIRLAAKGMAEYMGRGSRVVIAYDTRIDSRFFAEETARVLAKSGIKAILFDRVSPVPLLSFAVRYLCCDGGIVITASHNTKEYNGFKTYNKFGIQMNPEATGKIFENMKNMKDPLDITMSDISSDNITFIGEDIAEKFTEQLMKQSLLKDETAKNNLNVLYTPLYGSGRDYVKTALKKDGFFNLRMVSKQSEFNGQFPGLDRPNPEDVSVFKYAEKAAREDDIDIIIATDPDCDRIGVGVNTGDNIEYLNGNETGALLIDFISKMKFVQGKYMITTIVTGDLGAVIAEKKGANVLKTLTGSKFICEEIQRIADDMFIMGYEESYGYVTANHVRDKDGISAAMFICEMAAYYKTKGLTLIDVLNELYKEFGFYVTFQDSFDFEGHKGAEKIKTFMNNLRLAGKSTFTEYLEENDCVDVIDYREGVGELPVSNVLKFIFEDGSWAAVRPSGTEPKIKFYYCIKGKDRESAESFLRILRNNINSRINML